MFALYIAHVHLCLIQLQYASSSVITQHIVVSIIDYLPAVVGNIMLIFKQLQGAISMANSTNHSREEY